MKIRKKDQSTKKLSEVLVIIFIKKDRVAWIQPHP